MRGFLFRLKRKLLAVAKPAVIFLYRRIADLIPVDPKLIVFDSSQGRNYTGNPRAIYEYFLAHKTDLPFRFVWCFRRDCVPASMPGAAKTVRYRGFLYFFYTARAKFWIFDARNVSFLKKKAGQHYIQTWHGTPLKKLGTDIQNVQMPGSGSTESYHKAFLENTSSWDYLIAQNTFSETTFRRCFDFHGTILRTGYPRNDVLFSGNEPGMIRRFRRELGIPEGKKVLLYAPTFRDNQFDTADTYTFVPPIDFGLLQKALSDEYVMIVKYHYLVADRADLSAYKGFVYSVGSGTEISTLYLVSDKLITDYSSVMFDYSLLHRPMYFFCYDLAEYRDTLRGFYFDFLAEAPGPVSETTEQLIADIKRSDEELDEVFGERREAFYRRYHEFETGRASQQVAELVESLSD